LRSTTACGEERVTTKKIRGVAAAGESESQAARGGDPEVLALRIAGVAGVHDAGRARRNHLKEQRRHGGVHFAQAGGEPVEQRALAELGRDRAPVGVHGLTGGHIQETEKLAGIGSRASLAAGAGAHGQSAALPQ
jgi:hypothetical protein